jgi:hypothetical protein
MGIYVVISSYHLAPRTTQASGIPKSDVLIAAPLPVQDDPILFFAQMS